MNREKKKFPGILIAAVGSGNGKTTVTCALLEALKARGITPCAAKCGPDYIDPMFHQKVLGIPSGNLDSFFSDEETLRKLYVAQAETGEIAVVEGVMGLFDGLGGIREEGSAYHLASILGLPILLVVDAHGMGRSILPLLAGFLSYDTEKRIRGVLLNRTSASFCDTIAPLIEKELSLPVLGFLPNRPELALESRHLGLKLPDEVKDLQAQIRYAAGLLEKYVSVDKILAMAGDAEALPVPVRKTLPKPPYARLGVAKDEAFCFYYEENLRLLREAGAELVFFSPLHDKTLPDGLDGLLLGGGYPELYAKELEVNRSMRASVREALCQGMPSLAECGGFLYLHETLVDEKGEAYQMCGVVEGKCFYTGRLVRFGYVEVTEKEAHFLKKGTFIKGHEFHYYDSEQNGADCTARKPVTGKSWDCVQEKENHFWGFPHLYYPSNPDFPLRFVRKLSKN